MKIRTILTVLLLTLLCVSAFAQEKDLPEKKSPEKKARSLSPSEIIDSLEKNSRAIMLVCEANELIDRLNNMLGDTTEIKANQDTISRLRSVWAAFPADTLLQRQKSKLENDIDTLTLKRSTINKRRSEFEALTEQIKENEEQLKAVTDSLNLIDSLRKEIAAWENNLQNIRSDREKAVVYLKLLTDRKGLLDTCVIRTALDALKKPYDEENVQGCLQQFKLMHSDLQLQLAELPVLLKQYRDFYDSYRGLLIDLQYDEYRTELTLKEAYANKWIGKIKSQSYYKTYYGKGWSIPYLDAKYKELMSRLEKNKKVQKTTQLADFMDLIHE